MHVVTYGEYGEMSLEYNTREKQNNKNIYIRGKNYFTILKKYVDCGATKFLSRKKLHNKIKNNVFHITFRRIS